MDGIAGGGGMYSEPNTIIKAAHIHVEGDPSKYTFHVSLIHFFFLQSDGIPTSVQLLVGKLLLF